MTVKDAIDMIKFVKERSKFLYALGCREQDGHTKDYLLESSELLDEYVDMLEQMKVQTGG